jgi:hypothetical protein
MKTRYNNAVIYIYGKVNRKKIEEATVIFMTKIKRSKDDGNDNKTRSIKEK